MSGPNWQANNLKDGTWGDTLFPHKYRSYLPTVGAITILTSTLIGGLLYWIVTLPYPK